MDKGKVREVTGTLRLILMRHGHSPMSAHSDHMRTLSSLGAKQASYTGQRLADWPSIWTPQLILVSDAQRTQETFTSLCSTWSSLERGRAKTSSELYLASAEQWRLILAERSQVTVVMCLGHNPGISDLIGVLCGQWVNLEVGEAVGLSVRGQAGWRSATQAKWELQGRVRPNDELS